MKEKSSHKRNRGIASSSPLGRLGGVVFFVLVLLSSCAKDDVSTTLPTDASQYAHLKVGIGGASTYVAASPAEKELRSVAFFVQTQSGTFTKYLSGENADSEMALSLRKLPGDGYYDAAMKIKVNDLPETAQIYVIGNYAENGLTQTLLADINSEAELMNLQSIAMNNIGKEPQCPLLIYGYQNGITLTKGATTSITDFTLERVAARIDFEAKLLLTGTLGDTPPTQAQMIEQGYFELVSARLANPKSQSYLFPSQSEKIKAIPRLDTFEERRNDTDNPLNVVAGNTIIFYTYEMVAGDMDIPLTIHITYKSRTSKSEAYTENGFDLTFVPTSNLVERNKSYLVTKTISVPIPTDWY